jgi:hypothetical protein
MARVIFSKFGSDHSEEHTPWQDTQLGFGAVIAIVVAMAAIGFLIGLASHN